MTARAAKAPVAAMCQSVCPAEVLDDGIGNASGHYGCQTTVPATRADPLAQALRGTRLAPKVLQFFSDLQCRFMCSPGVGVLTDAAEHVP
jgi:hypothetical protein